MQEPNMPLGRIPHFDVTVEQNVIDYLKFQNIDQDVIFEIAISTSFMRPKFKHLTAGS